ncbi:MAG TPA: D-tagatose-bisphosphate aldolase, class II, non-catalytic subunit [Rhizomicrobium sp.]|jgi:D-tagatose-1,6-bisphosphate aldolase subunit GatZ/KbaZ|nr:D-tagatose-bisphosphate aldolase, class II, non-catalytic subunit [Rhizomicrobium sp.]
MPSRFQEMLSANGQRGITSICSAHPLVVRAAIEQAAGERGLLLIEATCNQVNQDGGYTGMRPADFRAFVQGIMARASFPEERLLLGGDHLGPHPWRKLSAEDAMVKAEAMIAAYAKAGFTKIHLDASMPCGGDPAILPDEIVAARAARLAKVAEQNAATGLFYIIGTEVPVPGGASQGHELAVTTSEAAAHTLAIHKQAFMKAGLEGAWGRVVGLVVQPGVEFDNLSVIDYQPDKASALVQWRRQKASDVAFEAHSTDFQRDAAYGALVTDGFAILKVGPGLTFAMREAIFALANIENEIVAVRERSRLVETIRTVMMENPAHWRDYYKGADQEVLLFNSYSDRIRYYWPDLRIEAAMAKLIANLRAAPLPDILLSRDLPAQYARVRGGELKRDPEALIVDKVRDVLRVYSDACRA